MAEKYCRRGDGPRASIGTRQPCSGRFASKKGVWTRPARPTHCKKSVKQTTICYTSTANTPITQKEMEIFIESPVSSTDRSLPPTTPPDPSSLPFPPNTAPPSPPSYSVPPNNPVVDRHILQPVPSSKRAPTDMLPQSKSVVSETINSYLPRELATIVEERRRCERA
ncbi:hypothetical protein K3495_g5305 [Podosphaera aphanis]|nr:hypothetical protein K3495_g5305 [Podosphaera aphanis]